MGGGAKREEPRLQALRGILKIRAVAEILTNETRRTIIVAGGDGLPVERDDVDIGGFQQGVNRFEVDIGALAQLGILGMCDQFLNVVVIGDQGGQRFVTVQKPAESGDSQPEGRAALLGHFAEIAFRNDAAASRHGAITETEAEKHQQNPAIFHRSSPPVAGIKPALPKRV
ncbi:hypothetical protein D3C86_1137140 [compost metagenome]